AVTRQRRCETSLVLAGLDHHEPLLGQDDLDDILLADEFAPCAVAGHEPLRDTAVVIAVDAVQRLGIVSAHMHERSFVIQLFDRAIHPREPFACILRVGVEHDESEKRAGHARPCATVRNHRASPSICGGASSIMTAFIMNGCSIEPMTVECTDVRLSLAYSPWCSR